MIRVERVSKLLAILAIIVTHTTLVSAQTAQYTAINLGTLGGSNPSSGPTGINSYGQVTGTANGVVAGTGYAFLWTAPGPMVSLGALGSQATQSNAMAINDSSWVAGESNSEAFLYTPQSGMQGLGFLPGGTLSQANDVNNAGTIAGVSATAGMLYLNPFIWYPKNGMRDLNSTITNMPTAWTPTSASLINNGGVIAGIGYANLATYPPSGAEHAFVLNRGTLNEIPDPGTSIYPEGINSSGEVVGFYGGDRAFEYTAFGGTRDIGNLGGAFAGACGINDRGMIVGSSDLPDGNEAAFLYSDSMGMVDLNTLVQGNGWTLTCAFGINDNGQIVAQGTNGSEYDAFLLTPTPEPSTFGLFLAFAGFIMLLQLRRRRPVAWLRGLYCEVARRANRWRIGSASARITIQGAGGRLVLVFVTVIAAFNATAASAQTVEYAVTDLGTFGGASLQSGANAINNQGQVVGWATDPTTGVFSNAFYWGGGKGTPIQNLGTLDGQITSVSNAVAINNSGWVTGSSDNGNATDGFLWTGSGSIQSISGLSGTVAEALGINDAGVVVGGYRTGSGALDGFVYSKGVMTDTGTLVNDSINNAGQIAAYYSSGIGFCQTYLISPNGTFRNIGSFGGTSTQPNAMNQNGAIVGFSTTTKATYAFVYSGGTLLDLGVLNGAVTSDAFGINSEGNVVGESDFADGSTRAFLYAGSGPMQDLNNLIDPTSGWTLESANGINDNGQIVGIGISPTGNEQAFLLTPTPEPSTFGLLLAFAGFIMLLQLCRTRPVGWLRGLYCEVARRAHSWRTGTASAHITFQGAFSGLVLMFLTTIVTLYAIAGSAQTVEFAVTDLGTFGGASLQSAANAINGLGQVVGAATDPATGSFDNAFFYAANGKGMKNLGTLDGRVTSVSSAVAINDSGWVAGTSDSGSTTLGFLWTGGGTIQSIGTLGGPATYVYGMNNGGTVVGASQIANGAYDGFTYNNGTLTNTGTLVNDAINDSGEIAAISSSASGTSQTYLVSSNGLAKNIGSFGGKRTQPEAINNAGQIVGLSETTNATDAFLYSNGVLTNLGLLPGASTANANAINDSGDVVGTCGYASGASRPFLYGGGQMTDLNSLIDPDSGWLLESATGINDNRQIVGTGIDPSGDAHAYLLTPTPEPSAAALLVAAACSLLIFGYYRRRRFKYCSIPEIGVTGVQHAAFDTPLKRGLRHVYVSTALSCRT